jgi:hypothetical protein
MSPPGGRHSHDSPDAKWPTLGGKRSHDSAEATPGRKTHTPEANPGRERTQLWLARGHARVGDAVTARLRPTPGGRRSQGSPEANPKRETRSGLARGHPQAGDAVTPRSRTPPGGRRGHGSPEANLGREAQVRVARGQPRAGDAVTTHPRPTPGRRRSHDSPKANPGREMQSHLVGVVAHARSSQCARARRRTRSRRRGLRLPAAPLTSCCTTRSPARWRRCPCSVLQVGLGWMGRALVSRPRLASGES